ncbi:MAG: RNA polymerase sigma factor [Bacilli bacterium]|nr:RNA polymerase sigma factor [Bacilli bacterium]
MKLINLSLNSGICDSLINKIAKGDERAFDELYEKTKRIVFSTALSITRSVSDSEDITQEVYVRIFEKAGSYKDKNKPLAWIYAITKNQSISVIRKKQKTQEIENMEDDIRFSNISNNIDKLILKSALEILTEEELQIVMLHNSGLKHREIATLLDKQLSTILSKYNRSLLKMKKYLESK